MQPPRIGRAAPSRDPGPGDPVDLLLDCHGRIRHFTALALRLLQPGEARPVSAEQLAEAARSLTRYFGVALPLHVADEDVSIARRFAARPRPAEVAAALDDMTAQHVAIDRLLDALVPAWTHVARDPAALEQHRPALAPKSAALAALMEAHLAAEEATIFPWLRGALDADARAAILAEMRARRVDSYLPENGTL